MSTESTFRVLFFILLVMLFAMRAYFMIKVRRSGGRIMPDEGAIQREGGRGFFIFRVIAFFALMAFLVMYAIGMAWIDALRFPLADGLRWVGFALGFVSVIFWTWTQVILDTHWSAQLQLAKGHRLITTGPYSRIRHPLYTALLGWCAALSLLTANWIFIAVCALSAGGLLWRVPKEEQMMIEAFGEEYKSYIQRTARFFPKL